MTEKRREEIKQIVERFIEAPLTQTVLDEFCKLNGFEPTVVGEVQDYIVQVKHDATVALLFKEMLAELQNLQYTPEYDTAAHRKQINEQNNEVRVNLVKLMEKHALEYRFVSTVADELGGFIGGVVKLAGQTAFNKALEVMTELARERFGALLNMKHVADYAQSLFEKAEQSEKNKNTAKEVVQPTSPTNDSEGGVEGTQTT